MFTVSRLKCRPVSAAIRSTSSALVHSDALATRICVQRGVHFTRGLRAGRVRNKGNDGRTPSKGMTAAPAGHEPIVSMEAMHCHPSRSNSGNLKHGIAPGTGVESIGGYVAVDMTIT